MGALQTGCWQQMPGATSARPSTWDAGQREEATCDAGQREEGTWAAGQQEGTREEVCGDNVDPVPSGFAHRRLDPAIHGDASQRCRAKCEVGRERWMMNET